MNNTPPIEQAIWNYDQAVTGLAMAAVDILASIKGRPDNPVGLVDEATQKLHAVRIDCTVYDNLKGPTDGR